MTTNEERGRVYHNIEGIDGIKVINEIYETFVYYVVRFIDEDIIRKKSETEGVRRKKVIFLLQSIVSIEEV